MKEQELLNRYLIVELLLYCAVAYFLSARYWQLMDEQAQRYALVLLGGVLLVRMLSTAAIRLVSSDESKAGSTYWFSFAGNLIAGLGWGGFPLFLYMMNIPGITEDFIFPLANVGIAILALAASGMMATSFIAYSTPAFGLPWILSIHVGQAEMGIIWGFFFLISLLVASASQRASDMVRRYRKVSKGNKELYEKLLHSRDEALNARREIEKVNAAIKEEITERKLAEERIKASEKELNQILQDMIDTYFRVDRDGNISRISPSVQQMLGLSPGKLLGQPFESLFVDPSELRHLQDALVEQYGLAENVVVRFNHSFGESVWVSINVHTYKNASGEVAGFEGVARDVTESINAAEELFQEKERLHVTLESIGDAVITTNTNCEVQYINPVGESMTGWDLEEAKGKNLEEVLHLVDEESAQKVVLPLAVWVGQGRRMGLADSAILRNREGNGTSAIELSGSPIRDSEKRVMGAVLVFRDVTKLRSLAKELAYQATHDALTGLINRLEFDSRAEGALHSARDNGVSHALCYIDLDQFKVVNDTSGHQAGDELLKQVTELMRKQLRQSDTLARLGGDEFGLLLNGCDIDRAGEIAEKIREAVEEFRFVWGENTHRVGTSIGVVPITHESGTLTDLLSAADSACYVAKEGGEKPCPSLSA